MRSSVFCVISAIKNDYGVFSYEERFDQLLDTIKSIRLHSPTSDIVVYDVSYDCLPKNHLDILKKLVNHVDLLHNHYIIRNCSLNRDKIVKDILIFKTLGEIVGFLKFLSDLKNYNVLYDRVFKICGRYKLNQHFNEDIHFLNKNKIVIRAPQQWVSNTYPLRLWSFDYNLLPDIIKLSDKILQANTNTTSYLTIEYAMYEFIQALNIPTYEVKDLIGIEGLMGLDKTKIFE